MGLRMKELLHIEKLREIPASKDWEFIELVNKGWSDDVKYHVVDRRGCHFLLRLSHANLLEQKRQEYERLGLMAQTGICMSLPVDFGLCNRGENIWMLLTWLEGSDAPESLLTFHEKQQYALGLQAGKILGKIHSVPAPEHHPRWSDRLKIKAASRIAKYRQCGISLPDEQRFIAQIEDNLELLENRNSTLQHGDFHPGNMILMPGRQLGIIDFNRMDFGDPWEEFNRVSMFTSATSPLFASGQLHGYFKGDPPEEFFRLLAWYAANDCVGGLVWSIPFGKEEIAAHKERCQRIFEDFEGFTASIPKWYKPASSMFGFDNPSATD